MQGLRFRRAIGAYLDIQNVSKDPVPDVFVFSASTASHFEPPALLEVIFSSRLLPTSKDEARAAVRSQAFVTRERKHHAEPEGSTKPDESKRIKNVSRHLYLQD